MKTKVVATSTSCLDYYEGHDIDLLRLKLMMDGKEYVDGLTITPEVFYTQLRNNPSWVPKTSLASPGELLNYFEGLAKQGYKRVFVCTISSHLSGTYNAINQVIEELAPIIEIINYDTKTVCFSEGYFALEAEKMFKENKSVEEVIKRLDYLKENNTIFFAVDSLTQLINNGRLSGAQAFLGKVLKIKPVLQVEPSGKIVSIERTRNIKKALEIVAEKVKDFVKDKPYYAHILYAGSPELKGYFNEVLKEKLGLENLHEAPCSPVVGAHIGPDVVGIGIFLK